MKHGQVYHVRSCVKALILNDEGKMLILRNREPGHETDQQFWDLPGGGVENWEGDYACLQREIKEELGLTLKTIDGRESHNPGPQPIVQWETPHYVDKNTVMQFRVYQAKVEDLTAFKLSDEHDSYNWIDPRDHRFYAWPVSFNDAMPVITLFARRQHPNNNALEIFETGLVERAHALAKWGDKPRTPAEWAIVLEEEVNECKAAYAKSEDNELVMLEMLQVFATSLGCLMEHGWRLRKDLHPKTWQKMKELGFDKIIGTLQKHDSPL